ncbi:uncharacterized protein LOC131972984 [Centropristis striata]|uniref:uncharacterized protein LOC131972984 n=1 Tax=Centropristis striata TaxID=184440 RepID=UPI0027DFAE1F|nr:uncharacterized protein LOC131972984 [Centropristis striata]
MGSGASVSEEARPERLEAREAGPEPARTSTPVGRSGSTLQADEEAAKPQSHTVEIQSETVAEGEEVSLDFESFLHNNGMLYSCFNHHGNRVYVDESQNLQPFPKEWYSQGRFITPNTESSSQLQTPASSQPAVREDDRTGTIYIQGKGTVMTYMFEERVNVCRFWDPQSGVWLLLPLQWEIHVEFVKARVQRVMSTLPGLVDQKEITAALRQCNYDSEEVISVYLAMFGEILLQASPSGDQNYTDLNSFRALLERDRVIEDLRQKLQTKEKEADNLFQRNSYLAREVRYLSEVIQHLNQKLAELEADQQEAREKIRSLLNRRAPAVPPAKTITKPAVEPDQLRQVSRLTRELNVSNKQLRSTVGQALTDMKNQLEQLKGDVGKLSQVEQEAAGEVEELRSLYRKEAVERKSLYNKLLELQGNIRVFCRCRTSSASSCCLEAADDQEVAVVQKGSRRKFQFDKVYPQSSTQEEVFAGTLPVITSCVDGYNVCILAYGQTGSGKTYTMMGSKENPGVNIRSIRELLRICAEKEKVAYTLKISMLEIYNDSLNDLLAKSLGAALDIRVQGKSVSVPGLTQIQVQTEADILNVMETGEKNRKIASTKMNIQSSRSHLVVTLQVEGSDEVSGLTSRGTLTLCDLAGSERISKTEAEGQRLVEAAAINKSLTALGQVFSALKCNALHIPFRNSKLTHLLQPCLSGDAKCCVFVNVNPDIKDVAETLSTLQFGSTIRQVSLGKATQNIVPAKNNKTVK